MKRTSATSSRKDVADELRPEYDFDYTRARPNPYAAQFAKDSLVVVLDQDIAEVFKTPEAVKAVLRALIATMPKPSTRKPARKPQ